MSLLLSYYGDDFTGSTDAMETLTCAGVRTVLFLAPPTPAQLARFEGVAALGIAGTSRTLSPTEMDRVLPTIYGQLRALGSKVVHYKTCSTFDSSPEIGSIGRALELGQTVFPAPFVPLVVGAPSLGRYCVFGNLFARSGLDSDPYRLDRHPGMRRHPVTPMQESDLRLHLAAQTRQRVGLVDVLELERPVTRLRQRLTALHAAGHEVVLFDTLDDNHLRTIGELLWTQAQTGAPLFAVGSSGLETALTAYWRDAGLLPEPPRWPPAGRAAQVLVVSGSCSPVTEAQIGRALASGFAELPLAPERLLDPTQTETEVAQVTAQARAQLGTGANLIMHSCRGPDDPRIAATTRALEAQGSHDLALRRETSRRLGGHLGRLLKHLLETTDIRRVAVVGGDTSGWVAAELGLEALEMLAPLAPGTPLCRAHAPGSALDGLEIVFKGGQTGWVDFFQDLLGETSRGGAA